MAYIKFTVIIFAYLAGVWFVLAYVPIFSLAARTKMTPWLWLNDFMGFFIGTYLVSAVVDMLHGGRPLAYGKWDMRKYREPKDWVTWVTVALQTAFGVFCANAILSNAIH